MKKAVFYFPQNLYPPQSGLQKRGLEMVAGLNELGYQVTLLSSPLSAYQKWDPEGIETLKKDWVAAFHMHRPGRLDRKFSAYVRKFYRKLDREPPENSIMYTPPGFRGWFRQVVDSVSPELLIVTHARWDGLVSHRRFRHVVRVMETIDLVTLNKQMWQAVDKHLPSSPINPDQIDDAVVDELFYAKLRLRTDPAEYRLYDKYTHTIAISSQEAELIGRNTARTRVHYIPMTQPTVDLPNCYCGSALLPTGPNPYNVQGYLYFIKRVLPLVRRAVSSFDLQVTGYCADRVVAQPGITPLGYVPDLAAIYSTAKFVICPIFGGTGQQVKIVESMAHGVPVIALRHAADRSPIVHGVNGMIADTAEEFAEHTIALWNDPALCKRLGEAARATIATQFSRAQLADALSLLTPTQQSFRSRHSRS